MANPICHLLALPAELLHHIAEAASIPERTGAIRCWDGGWLGHPVDRGALFNLALTCRTLADVALPRLYRCVTTTRTAYGTNDEARVFLIHTLCQRPDLAAHVEELTVGGDRWAFCDAADHDDDDSLCYCRSRSERELRASPDEAALFDRAFREHGIGGRKPYQLRRIDETGYGSGHRTCRYKWSRQTGSAAAALAIVKSPNVRRLILQTSTRGLPAVKSAGTLDRLTEVCWSHCNDGPQIWLEGFDWLTAAAPALRRLAVFGVLRICRMVPCSLTELVLSQAWLDRQSIHNMCRAFPKLRRLSFSIDWSRFGQRNTTCARVLGPVAKTYGERLQYLHVDWSMASREVGQWDAAAASLAKLKSMTSLTELVVAAPFIHRRDGQDQATFWGGLLAPNLEVVRFEKVSGAWDARPLLSAIAESCSRIRGLTVECDQAPGDEAAVRSMIDLGRLRHDFNYTVMRAFPIAWLYPGLPIKPKMLTRRRMRIAK
ncbi:hypothetical protein V2A60_002575 [Cordyceps javanica]